MHSPMLGLARALETARLREACCRTAAKGSVNYLSLSTLFRVLPAKLEILRVGDAGIEPATSAV